MTGHIIQKVKIPAPKVNRLLAKLQPEDYEALMLVAKVVPLKYRKRLFLQDGPVEAIFFPINCTISLVIAKNGHPQLELATIGREGVVGAAEFTREQGAMCLSLIQVPGFAVRIDVQAFKNLLTSRPTVQKLVDKHLYTLMRQIMYKAACNRLHTMEERCARWLLMTHDRAGMDTFRLTQEHLSHMLGVRRATVNVATGSLRKAGFIQYVRGRLTVIDRGGLESASCDCYSDIIRAYESLLPNAEGQAL